MFYCSTLELRKSSHTWLGWKRDSLSLDLATLILHHSENPNQKHVHGTGRSHRSGTRRSFH